MSDVRRMPPAEFRDEGFLQEANRRFFHPLGLALAVVLDEKGEGRGYTVLDARDSEGGFVFEEAPSIEHADRVQNAKGSNTIHRLQKYGWIEQPAGVPAPIEHGIDGDGLPSTG